MRQQKKFVELTLKKKRICLIYLNKIMQILLRQLSDTSEKIRFPFFFEHRIHETNETSVSFVLSVFKKMKYLRLYASAFENNSR